jgi:hypothetical protein
MITLTTQEILLLTYRFMSGDVEIGMSKCLYCDKETSEDLHFVCEVCGVGMCDECYRGMTEHDGHFNRICETAEYPDAYLVNGQEPDYLCEHCAEVLATEYYKINNITL